MNRTRRLTLALSLLLLVPALPASAQDETTTTTPGSRLSLPGEWQAAALPMRSRRAEVHDVTAGGPGFIAVGRVLSKSPDVPSQVDHLGVRGRGDLAVGTARRERCRG